MSKNNNGGGFLLGALFGAAVAGITALLYAPKAGEELRKDMANEVDVLLDKAREYKDSAFERGVEMFDAAAEAATEATEEIKINVKAQVENVKNQFNELKEEGLKFVDKKRAEVEEVVDEKAKDLEELAEEVTE